MKRYGGVLLICKETNNFLLLKRNKKANFGNTWSIVSGGIEENEPTLDGIKRELKEETQINCKNIDFRLLEEQNNVIVPKFYFYLGYCDKEYQCILDMENTNYGWFNMKNLPDPLFPTLYSSLLRIF
jgi:ADP-ribose pyrophosphatase YjhB (NUDIX family)